LLAICGPRFATFLLKITGIAKRQRAQRAVSGSPFATHENFFFLAGERLGFQDFEALAFESQTFRFYGSRNLILPI